MTSQDIHSEHFWPWLLNETGNLEQPQLFKAFFDTPFCTETAIKTAFQTFSSHPLNAQGDTTRIFVNGQSNIQNKYHLHAHPPDGSETLKAWSDRLWEGQEFGIVINQMETFSEEMAAKTAAWVQPFWKQQNTSIRSVELVLFLGNYKTTPFGIHIDRKGSRDLVTVTGPDAKTMTLWDKASFQHLTGSKAKHYFDTDHVMAHGQNFVVEPGDLFHLPVGSHYHLGSNHGFTASVHLLFKTLTDEQVNQKALQAAGADLSQSPQPQVTFGQWMDQALAHYQLLRDSNAGLSGLPLPGNYSIFDLQDKTIQRVAPFPLILEQQKEAWSLFIRGRKLKVTPQTSLPKLIDHLNTDQGMLATHLLESVGMDKQQGLLLLTQLANLRGLRFL